MPEMPIEQDESEYENSDDFGQEVNDWPTVDLD